MRFSGSFTDLGSLVTGALRTSELETRLKEQRCLMVWDEVVGQQVSGAAQPEFIRDGCMFVITKNPVWANELMFYKKDLISRLNSRVGGTVLKEIIFKAGKIQRKKKQMPEGDTETPDIEGIKLSNEEIVRIQDIARAAGEESFELMEKLLSTSLKVEKWKKAHGWTPCSKCEALQNSPNGVCPVCNIGK